MVSCIQAKGPLMPTKTSSLIYNESITRIPEPGYFSVEVKRENPKTKFVGYH